MNTEPVSGTIYEFKYVGGAPYDPYSMTSKGVFLKKMSLEGRDYYLVATKMKYQTTFFFYVYYLYKGDILKSLGPNTDEDFTDLFKAIESPDFKHPKHLRTTLTPNVYVSKEEMDVLSGKKAARQKIGNFMTQAIFAPPIRNANDRVLFSGGPMYKRALASFSQGNRRGGSRKRNKRRNKTRKN